jgi:hypothetical protein
MEDKKQCTKCGENKKLEEYSFRKDTKKYRNYCKTCHAAYRAEYYQQNSEKIKARVTEYYKQNPEKIAACKAEYYKQNAEKIAEYRKQNAEKIAEYRKQNAEKIVKRTVNYIRERRATDPLFKTRHYISNLIRNSIRAGGFSKSTKTANTLGCTFEEFKTHIEAQFKPGMSWDNAGEWEYDHIIPLATATTEEEIIKLNHYSNFQPLWAKENRSKGSLHNGKRHRRPSKC